MRVHGWLIRAFAVIAMGVVYFGTADPAVASSADATCRESLLRAGIPVPAPIATECDVTECGFGLIMCPDESILRCYCQAHGCSGHGVCAPPSEGWCSNGQAGVVCDS